jgi:diacylglycerol O-acyltransferase
MKQLAGGDDIWFRVDTETTPMHILEAGVYDASTCPSGSIELQDVKEFVGARLGGLPLRQKLLSVPWNADFPYWIEDEDFDLDRHLHQVEVKPPGDWRALLATLAEIVEVPLGRSRPLWDMYLITGLGAIEGVPENCFALARKVHHGQFDGTNIIRLSSRLHSAEIEAEPPPADHWSPDRTPSTLELLARAPWNRARRLLRGAQVFGQNAPRLIDMLAPQGRQAPSGAKKRPIPHTRFSGPIGTRARVMGGVVFSLDGAKAIRHGAEGATLNDVGLAIATGALRSYLLKHGELPADPLEVIAPVSAHEKDEKDSSGNRISIMFVTLPTQVADPLQRLRLVRESTSRSKDTSRKIGAGNVADMIDAIPTYLLGPAIEQIVRLGLTEYLPLPGSGPSITNVAGPRTPSYFNGARLVRGVGCPFLFDGVGLIIAVTSYCDEFQLHFGSTPEMMADPEFFSECLRGAYDELAAVR